MANSGKDKEMPFLSHLEELRWRLVKSAVAVLIGAILLFSFQTTIIDFIYMSMMKLDFPTYRFFCWLSTNLNLSELLCPGEIAMSTISTETTAQFSTAMYFAIVGGLVIAFPYIFYQIWNFIRPALKDREMNVSKGLVFYTSVLFFAGILFGYFVISPLCVQFFGNFKLSDEVQNMFTISSYMSLITTTTFFSGLFFEMPVVIYLLSKLGIVSPELLKKYRKHALVAILILSAILTPPDVISQVLVSLPLLGLYEIGILVSKMVARKKSES